MQKPAPVTSTSTTTTITVTTRRAATPPRTTSSVCWVTYPHWPATGVYHFLLFCYFTHTVVKSYIVADIQLHRHYSFPFIPSHHTNASYYLSTEARTPLRRWLCPWPCTATNRTLTQRTPSLCRTTQVTMYCMGRIDVLFLPRALNDFVPPLKRIAQKQPVYCILQHD